MRDIEEVLENEMLMNMSQIARNRMLRRKWEYEKKRDFRRALVALFVLLAFIAALIFVMIKEKETPVVKAEVTERRHVTLQPVEPQIRPHVTLEPVEPGYIPDADHYYIPWADRLKISLDDFELLCQTTQCEAGNQSMECKKYVARAILNRLYSDKFPNTMHDVIYQRNSNGDPQFSVIDDCENFPYTHPVADSTETACYLAIAEADDIPNDMLYFNSIGYFSWATNYKKIGAMYFSRG